MTNKQKAFELLENIYPEARQQIIETAQKITSEIQNTDVKLTSDENLIILELVKIALSECSKIRDFAVIAQRRK